MRFPSTLIVALAVATLLAVIAACASDPTATPTPRPTATPTPTASSDGDAMAPTATAAPAEPTATPTTEPTATPTPVDQPVYGGVLRIGHRADPPAAWDTMRSTNYNLTPITAAIAGEGNFVQACFEDETTICPGFAESWEVNDNFTEWTFKIRDGLTWHDGAPLTNEEFRWWVDLFINGYTAGGQERLPGVARSQFGDIASVEAMPGNLVRITLNSPDAFYLESLGMHRIPIFHAKHLFEPAFEGGNLEAAPLELGNIGAGPFKFVSYERGVDVVLERFDDFYGTDDAGNSLPYLDGLEYFIMSDPAAFHAAFRTGQLDVGARGARYYVTPEEVPLYQQSLGDDVYFLEIAGGGGAGMGFNIVEGPFADKRLREAISLYVDRQTAVDTLLQGNGRVRGGFLDERSSNPDFMEWPGFNPDTKEADRARARQLVADVGAEGLEFAIILPDTQVEQMEWWVGAMDGLGLDPKLQVMDVTAFDATKAGTDWAVSWGGGSLDLGTPSSINFQFGRKSESPYASIVHEDLRIDAFAAELGTVTSHEERLRILRELEQYIYRDEILMVHSVVGLNLVPARGYVKNAKTAFVLNPPTYASYQYAWLDN